MHGWQAAAQAVIPTAFGAPAASQERSRGTGVFQAEFPPLVTAPLPPEAAGKPVEIWFGDQARVGQQGTLTRVWGRRGTRPRAPQDRRFQSAYLFGAVCPERNTGAAVVMPTVGIEAMNEHLVAISRCVSVGAIAVLVLDKAGWHTSARLKRPDNIVLLPCHRMHLNRTRLRTSGNTCARTGSATRSGQATKPLSMPVVRPGTNSCECQNGSLRSPGAGGQQ